MSQYSNEYLRLMLQELTIRHRGGEVIRYKDAKERSASRRKGKSPGRRKRRDIAGTPVSVPSRA